MPTLAVKDPARRRAKLRDRRAPNMARSQPADRVAGREISLEFLWVGERARSAGPASGQGGPPMREENEVDLLAVSIGAMAAR
jgi:hypothetical protein